MNVNGVEGDAITFSWGVTLTESGDLNTLCNKRDALSITELVEFCKLDSGRGSKGHDQLRQACNQK